MDTLIIVAIAVGGSAFVCFVSWVVAAYFFMGDDEETPPKSKPGQNARPGEEEAQGPEQKVQELQPKCDDPKLYTKRELVDNKWVCPSGFPHDTGINWTTGNGYFSSKDAQYNAWQCASVEACKEYVKAFATYSNTRTCPDSHPIEKSTLGDLPIYGTFAAKGWKDSINGISPCCKPKTKGTNIYTCESDFIA